MNDYLIVFLGAGIGGMARHGVNFAVMKTGTSFPWHTFIVNVIGSLLMGLLVSWLTYKGVLSQTWRLFAATGFLGGFTTFSSFSSDSALLWERGAALEAALYILSSVGVSLAALFLGLAFFKSM
ncbi:MAG: fluoride efflux transporter CrcB [Rhodomicrobium sp.]